MVVYLYSARFIYFFMLAVDGGVKCAVEGMFSQAGVVYN